MHPPVSDVCCVQTGNSDDVFVQGLLMPVPFHPHSYTESVLFQAETDFKEVKKQWKENAEQFCFAEYFNNISNI